MVFRKLAIRLWLRFRSLQLDQVIHNRYTVPRTDIRLCRIHFLVARNHRRSTQPFLINDLLDEPCDGPKSWVGR